MSNECHCKVCMNLGKNVHRAWVLERIAHFTEKPRDVEAEITKSWHSYAKHYLRVHDLLPRRASNVAVIETRDTLAVRQMRDWCDRTGEFGELASGEHYDPNIERTMVALTGRPGTGKTVAATWAVMHRLAECDPVLFLGAPELSRRRVGAELEAVDGMACIVIDDLGAEALDRKFVALFDEIVNVCYQAQAHLILTTNCTPADFQKRYGPRVVDRFAEAGTWITIPGTSMRKGAA